MAKRPLTCALSLLMIAVMACPLAAQTPQTPQTGLTERDQQRNLVKPDPKRAKKLAEQAAREEAAGDYVAALDDYEEAARYAPFDVNIVSKGVALRSRLLREHVDDAERLAILGDINGATLQLAAALEIDPGNPAVLERLQQMASMKPGNEVAAREEPAEGLPQLMPDKARKSFNILS